jgi:prepilin-type N-terminal cleavage/methylation domain-containing protein
MTAHSSQPAITFFVEILNKTARSHARCHMERALHCKKAMLSQRGFSLLEVLIAAAVVAVAVATLAQLVVLATAANARAKTTTMATVLAAQKIEQLRSLEWNFDRLEGPVSDPRLTASPSDSLRRNISGFCDFLDRNGESLGDRPDPPADAVYLRRWSIEPLPADPANVLVLQVLVTQRFTRGIGEQADRRLPDEARIVSIKSRKAR